MITFNFMCDMLVDQGRFIGSDPVGHKCGNTAVEELRCGAFICVHCKEILAHSPHRLSLPALYGREYQIRCIEAVHNDIMARIAPKPSGAATGESR